MARHPALNVERTSLPPYLVEVLASQPANVDRRSGARLISQHFFPVSHRTLEAWPLPTRRVNGKAITPTVRLFEHAFAVLSAAPIVMAGRRPARLRPREGIDMAP